MRSATQVRNLNPNMTIGIAVGFLLLLCGCGRTPSDQELVRRFEDHRAAYDRLRDLLVGDANLRDVGTSGVQMTNSTVHVVPPTPLASGTKYQEYMDLLKSAGAALELNHQKPPAVLNARTGGG
jgi:hypothetical protein